MICCGIMAQKQVAPDRPPPRATPTPTQATHVNPTLNLNLHISRWNRDGILTKMRISIFLTSMPDSHGKHSPHAPTRVLWNQTRDKLNVRKQYGSEGFPRRANKPQTESRREPRQKNEQQTLRTHTIKLVKRSRIQCHLQKLEMFSCQLF